MKTAFLDFIFLRRGNMRRMGIKTILFTAVLAVTSGWTTGCAGKEDRELPVVKLSVWWSDEEDRELIDDRIRVFQEEHADEAVFEITVSKENVMNVRETVLNNVNAAADVYMFADDQFEALRQGGALLEISEDVQAVIDANGGEENGACQAAMYDGKLYAYPLAAGNGYFLYYNKAYYTQEDIISFDRLLEIAAENGKKMTMDYSSGWYIYSFFAGAGLELGLSEDGVTNECNWNAVDTKYRGVDVAEAMLLIAKHDGFISLDDQSFLNGVRNGTIIAGINGPWNAEAVKAAWGENFGAAKLPCYTLAGENVQMSSFSGYKRLGVNPYSEHTEWAMRLAECLSDEQMQLGRFASIGECPSNMNAASSTEVQASPVIAALSEQSQFAQAQHIADAYWNPSYIFGITIAGGNPDGQDLQALLDHMVSEITKDSR